MPTRRALLAVAASVCALGALAPAAGAKPVYGVVPQDGALPSGKDLSLMPRAGISSIRLILHWGTIERVRGIYDWSGTDAVIRRATSRGIQPLPFLYGTPDWAAREDGRSCSANDCSVYPPNSDDTRQAFARFAQAAVKRYGPNGDFWKAPVSTVTSAALGAAPVAQPLDDPVEGRAICPIPVICDPPPPPPPPPPVGTPPPPTEPPCGCTVARPITSWQIWNEQNSPKYFAPRVNVNRYAALLSSAATAIKAADPGAEVILGGMWGPPSAKKVVTPVRDYLRALYRIDGITDSFDSIALHPYAADARSSLAQLKLARRVVTRSGDADAGTWITEIGWAAGGPRKNPYVKGLAGQARLLSRALTAYKRHERSFNLRGVFWYSWRDKKGGSAICEWCGYAGLRAKNGAAKPAWRAFARVAR